MSGIANITEANKLKSSLNQIEAEDIDKINKIIIAIKTNPSAINFILPVDTKLYHDYLKAINDRPMDITTIETKMIGKKYHFIQDVFDDFQLIWDNCRIYNKEGFEIYNQADRMEEVTINAFEKYYVIQKGEKKNYGHEFDNNIYDEEAFNDPNYYKENIIQVDPYYQNLKEKLEVAEIIKSLTSNQLHNLIEGSHKEKLKEYINIEKDNEIRIHVEMMPIEILNEVSIILSQIKRTIIEENPITSIQNN